MNNLNVFNTVSARELQRDYKAVFTRAKKLKAPIMVISNNEPQAVILSLESFNDYTESDNWVKLWDTIYSIQKRNQNIDPKEVEDDVAAAVKKARMKIYAETFGSARQQRNSKRSHLSAK